MDGISSLEQWALEFSHLPPAVWPSAGWKRALTLIFNGEKFVLLLASHPGNDVPIQKTAESLPEQATGMCVNLSMSAEKLATYPRLERQRKTFRWDRGTEGTLP